MQKNRNGKAGYGSYCKLCASAQVKESRIKNGWVPYIPLTKEQELKRKRDGQMKKKFNITADKLAELDSKRKGNCEICGDSAEVGGRWKNLHVDHCHATGKIRGLALHRL